MHGRRRKSSAQHGTAVVPTIRAPKEGPLHLRRRGRAREVEQMRCLVVKVFPRSSRVKRRASVRPISTAAHAWALDWYARKGSPPPLFKCDKALVRCALQPTKRRQRRSTARRSGAGRRGGAERGGEQQREHKALYFDSHESLSSNPRTCGPAHMALQRWAQRSWIRPRTHEPQLHVTLYQKPSPSPRDTERRRADTPNK